MTAEERNRFEKLEEQIACVRREMELRNGEMRKFMYGVKNSLDDLVAILKGDSTGYSDGLIKDVKKHDIRLRKLELVKNRLAWLVTGAALPSGYGIWEFVKKIFPPLVVLALFTACATPKKKEDLAYRFFRENPTRLAELAQIHYPVQARPGKLVFDTLRRTVFQDSLLCPDSTKLACPPCENLIVNGLRVDTVPDLAKIHALEGRLLDSSNRLAVLEHENARLKKQAKTRLFICIALGLGLILTLYLLFKP